MSVLLVTGLKKILGAQEILRGVDLRIERGQKVGCVGRNGEGKTTLLRIVEGEEPADGGTIQLAKGARIGYVTQRAVFEPGMTVRSWVESGLDEVHGVERELHAVGEKMAEAQGEELDRLVKRHGELTARMEFLEGWEAERRVETVLGGIGLHPSLWDREARTLSGGEKSRTAMARELVSVPDLLLLDEPTNHLDVTGIEWLEEYLLMMHSAVLMVSHDRRMLDRVADTIVEVERGQLVRYPGNYSRYLELKAERFQSALNAWEAQQDYLRKEDAFIKKHMGSQRTGEAKGRRKKLENVERLERPWHDVRRPVIQVRAAERGGELVVQTEGLAVGYGGRARVSNVDLRIGRGERVGIVGPNGSGKTTLLKVLAGRNAPLAGKLERGYKATCGYYDQETQDLRDESTPFLEIRRDHPQITDLEIRSHLARFLFRGDEVDLLVRGLSGGERARLSLARLVLTGPSWLALDEPTNHLDLAGRTALEEMLGAFAGTFLCVTHDREMLDRLATRIIEVKDGRARVFEGNYTDYRNELTAERAAVEEEAAARERKVKEAARRAESKAAAAPRPAEQPAKRPKNPWRLKKLEEQIIALEAERERLLAALSTEEVYRDQVELKETQLRLAEIERDLDEKNTEWEQFIG